MMRQSAGDSLYLPVAEFLDPNSHRSVLPETATIRDVMLKFRESGLGAVVITDEDDRPIGIFTPSDTPRITEAFRKNPRTPAKDIMSKDVYTVTTSDPLRYALEVMQEKRLLTGITVVERSNGKYVGYLYRPDLARRLDAFQGNFR